MKFPKDFGFNHCTLVCCTKLLNRIYYITLIVGDDCCAKAQLMPGLFLQNRGFFSFIFVHVSHAFKVFYQIVV